MPPQLALLLTIAFIVFLFRRERLDRHGVTGALWIPLIWMLIIGSRFVSQWLGLWGAGGYAGDSLTEGSPLDAAVFLCLIIAAFVVLVQRRVTLGQVFRQNVWLGVFLGYCFLSIAWSDFPLVAFKRFIKVLGHPLMALVVLSELNPTKAFELLMKRCAYVLVPFSIMLIKYFPEIGRGFDTWSGRAINMGVTINKNELGFLCFVLAYFLFWQLVGLRNQPRSRNRTQQFILVGGFLALTGWLLVMAKSSTAFAALAVGIGTMLLLGLRIVNKRRFALWVVGIVLVAVVAEYSFGVYRFVIEDVFGKNVTLTDRTEVWKDVLAVDINPILGAGFESFWLGGRLDILWGKWAFRPNQAHNGYIEIYVTLGWVGVTLFIAMILGTFRKAQVTLVRNFEIGRFRMGFLFAVLAYNYTEATFKALHIIWFVFYLAAMDYATRRARVPARQQFGRAVGGSAGAQEASAFDAAGSRLSPVR